MSVSPSPLSPALCSFSFFIPFFERNSKMTKNVQSSTYNPYFEWHKKGSQWILNPFFPRAARLLFMLSLILFLPKLFARHSLTHAHVARWVCDGKCLTLNSFAKIPGACVSFQRADSAWRKEKKIKRLKERRNQKLYALLPPTAARLNLRLNSLAFWTRGMRSHWRMYPPHSYSFLKFIIFMSENFASAFKRVCIHFHRKCH